MANNYEKLAVYQKAYELALAVHRLSLGFPREVQFNLADQLRRSSKSIPTNIAEGYGRNQFPKEYKRFLWISVGSKDETMVHLNFSKDLHYLSKKDYDYLTIGYEEVGRMLFGLIKSIKN